MRHRLGTIAIYLASFASVAVLVFPIAWGGVMSFAPNGQALSGVLPSQWTVENYVDITAKSSFWESLLHSAYGSIGATVVTLALSVPAGYGLARGGRRGGVVGMVILCVRMIPGVVLIIPFYILFQQLGMLDTVPALVLVYLTFSVPLGVWLARAAFVAVPRELDEAASIDGAARWRTLWSVILPAVGGNVLSIAVLVFVFCWNEFLFSVTLTSQRALTFLPLLTHYILPDGPQYGEIFAGATIFVIPPLVGLLLVRRRLSATFNLELGGGG
jgi:ABC-type glycerol-3-phosphate transport system permease component